MKNFILSPLPGKILEINVKVGEDVAKGQQVFIMESMKMEMPIASEVSGMVEKINVEVGANVKGQEPIITLM